MGRRNKKKNLTGQSFVLEKRKHENIEIENSQAKRTKTHETRSKKAETTLTAETNENSERTQTQDADSSTPNMAPINWADSLELEQMTRMESVLDNGTEGSTSNISKPSDASVSEEELLEQITQSQMTKHENVHRVEEVFVKSNIQVDQTLTKMNIDKDIQLENNITRIERTSLEPKKQANQTPIEMIIDGDTQTEKVKKGKEIEVTSTTANKNITEKSKKITTGFEKEIDSSEKLIHTNSEETKYTNNGGNITTKSPMMMASLYDPTKVKLQERLKSFTDTAEVATSRPFLTFFQTTRGNNAMATRLDYIFVKENYIQFCQDVKTQFGNSDHLFVECTFNFKAPNKRSAF
ncbi:13737_t:CDS:2 [Dentiscutata erythropus]|uniref:13737_t:CDS:1 n=1 Tax=Dentiscutata erythropus TaxID=1348616 RepID=A0A9N9FT22_9GLOM|nr:13737_t:CDS:2 [Dentiscutata erythropus]